METSTIQENQEQLDSFLIGKKKKIHKEEDDRHDLLDEIKQYWDNKPPEKKKVIDHYQIGDYIIH